MQKYKTVEDFINDLEDAKRLQVETLREIILKTAPHLEEHIKWNAPSYVLNGEDRITFNTMNKQGLVNLVLHMGATRKEDKKGSPVINDETGLVVWSSDIRGMITFASDENVQLKADSIKNILQKWLSIPT